MGLSVAISGAIILSVLMLVMMSMTGLVGNIFSIGSVTTQVSDLENTIDNTDISLETLFASTTPRVNFTLNNDDTEKLWNFDDFNVLIEYESASGDELEELSFGGKCQGRDASVGEWCIEGIAGDFLDKGILNEGESAEILTEVSKPLDNGNVRVTVSTDNGEVAMLPAPKRSWFDASPVPTATCEFATYGRTFVDTDSGVAYICDPTRDKWLSTETVTLYGENAGGGCGGSADMGGDIDCQINWGDALGGETTPPTIGLYMPYNMTIVGWGFSSDDDNCPGTGLDIEVWGSGTDTDDEPMTLASGAEVATDLDGTPQNANDANVDIEGNQYIIWGLDNNCGGGSIDDWNVILYTKWRHDQP